MRDQNFNVQLNYLRVNIQCNYINTFFIAEEIGIQLIASLFDGAGATLEKLYVFLSHRVLLPRLERHS